MQSFRVTLDLADLQKDLEFFKLGKFKLPFCMVFVEAKNPDDACRKVVIELINKIMNQDCSTGSRVLCQKIKRLIRIDRIEPV
tara:strand:- start:2812 stop:3060 length:249 start_codon:yes stop_codon:yes gene_type:complete